MNDINLHQTLQDIVNDMDETRSIVFQAKEDLFLARQSVEKTLAHIMNVQADTGLLGIDDNLYIEWLQHRDVEVMQTPKAKVKPRSYMANDHS
jgi:hypothetical protein|tara:strand:+ start:334 stop:612 length:279 start_codon:yes stop_codon:yes gene_type:complete